MAKLSPHQEYSPRTLAELVHRLTMASDVYGAAMARRLELGHSELAALEHLSAVGELTPTQLAERLSLTSGTITGLIDRLQRAGHLQRSPAPHDRRSTILRATPTAGAQARAAVTPLAADVQTAAQRLTPTERAAVGRFLQDVTAALEHHAAQPTRCRQR